MIKVRQERHGETKQRNNNKRTGKKLYNTGKKRQVILG